MANKVGKYKVSKRERYLDLQDTENNTPSSLIVDTDAMKVTQNGGVHIGGTDDPGDNNLKVDGTLTQVGIATFTAAPQFNGGYAGARTVVDLDGTTATPTVAQSGTIFTFDGSACEVTLPTCAAGLEYFFLVNTTQTGDAVITTQSADKLYGVVPVVVDGIQSAISNSTFLMDCNTGTNDNTFTMDGSTKGGVIGSYIRVFGMKANAWHISGYKIGSGTLVTSFS